MSEMIADHAPPSVAALAPRRICLLALLAIIAFAALSAIPIFGDMRATFSSAFLAGEMGSFPENISQPFHQRGYGYKCLYYGLYRAAERVVDSRSFFAFELATRLMYYSGFAILAVWFFWLLRKPIAEMGIHWAEAMLLFLVGILATSHHIHQQPEELALLWTAGLTAFSLSDNKLLNSLSGLFIPLLILCKIVTIWPAVFPLFIVLATRDRSRILRVGASWAVCFAATILFYVFLIPQEIADTRRAAISQSGFHFAPRDLQAAVYQGVWAIAHIPFYLVACVGVGWLLWRASEERKWKELLLALGAIAIALPPILLQKLHLCYYYLQFFPASFLIALWCLRLVPDAGRRARLLCAMAVMTFAGWAFFSTICVNADAYAWLWMKAAWHENATLQKMDRQFHLSDEPEILFLSPGNANYVIRTKSYLRYFYPVVLQRACFDKSLRDTEYFRDVMAKTLAYRGTYIFHSDWLPLDHLPELEAKLKNEYDPVAPKIEEHYPLADIQLFKRRSASGGKGS